MISKTPAETFQTIQELVQSLQTSGDRPCVLALQRSGSVRRLTYSDVAKQVHLLAGGLLQAGVGPGEHVLLLAKNSAEWLIASLSVLQSGAVITPLEHQIRADTLGRIVHDCHARFIFTTSDYLPLLQSLQDEDAEISVQPILLDAEDDDPQSWRAWQHPTDAPPPMVGPDDPAALFYTSGTTGVPKGVPLTHHNLAFQLHSLLATRLVKDDDRVLQPLPMYHIYPFTVGMLTPLAFRVPLVLPDSIAGPAIIRAIQEAEATLFIGVPRLYRAIYDRIESQVHSRGGAAVAMFERSLALSIWLRRKLNIRIGRLLFRSVHQQIGPSLRLLASGGSALDPDLAWKLDGLGWNLAIGYGLTETSPILTFNLPSSHVPNLASVGKALEGVDLYIDTSVQPEGRDPGDDSDLAPGEGEILARGPSVFAGYRNLPDQTAEVFTEDGWFRTGDMGYRDEQEFVYISGRASTLIVTEGGKNVQPEPVEEIYLQHAYIREIGILQIDKRLVAIVVPETETIDQRAQSGDVRQAVREAMQQQAQQIASYQRPGDYAITTDPLPRTNLGKLRRHLLEERYLQAKQGS